MTDNTKDELTNQPCPKSEEQEQPSQPSVGLFARVVGLLWAGTALLTVFSFWQQPFLLNLVSSFRVQLLAALTIETAVALFCFKGRRRLTLVGVTALLAFTFANYWLPAPKPGEHTVALAVSNVYSGNHDLSRLREWLSTNPVDVLGILEVSPAHKEQLEQLGFEHTLIEPRQGNFGIALLSRRAPVHTTLLDSDTPFPSILAEFEDVIVLVTHPVPPIDRQAREMGDQQTRRLAERLAGQSKPIIVLGDLNATAWDSRFEPLKDLGLQDSRRGFGILPTWPADRWWMRIPIDHILIPESWGVAECSRGPDVGSDHFPLRAVVGPRKN